jgi:hypothetical protein
MYVIPLRHDSPPLNTAATSRPTLLPRKHHQRRVQHNRQQQMTPHQARQRVNSNHSINPPHGRERVRPGDHQSHHRKTKQECETELLDQFRHLGEKRRVFDFFGCRAPRHVDLEHVREKGLRDVQADAGEEDAEEGHPFEIFPDCDVR